MTEDEKTDAERLARELWWPHHESRTRETALRVLDAGDLGFVLLEFRDVVAMVERCWADRYLENRADAGRK